MSLKAKYVLVLTLVVLLIRIWLTMEGFFPFTWDFGRDMLWVRQLTELHKPMLVGAWGSLDGTFFGPGYFYLLTIPYWLSGGDPRAAVAMVVILVSSLIPLSYWAGSRWFNERAGWWWAICFALLPIFTPLSLYSFPQQLIPVVFFALLVVLWEWRTTHKPRLLFYAGFFASLVFHFEPVDTPLGYALIAIVVITQRHAWLWKNLAYLMVGILLPFIPNILYDLRHEWIQLKAFSGLLQGTDSGLGGYMPLTARIVDRIKYFLYFLSKTVAPIQSPWLGLGFWIVVGAGFTLTRRRIKQPLLTTLGIFGLLSWLYFCLYPRLIKDFYLYYLPVLTCMGVGLWLATLPKKWRLVKTGILLWLLTAQLLTIFGQLTIPDTQQFRSQYRAVQHIYQDAGNSPFTLYAYTLTVYDFPYQYLIWWIGKRIFHTLPIEYAYKPDQPEYVINKASLDLKATQPTLSEHERIYLIMEAGDHTAYSRDYWRSLFPVPILKQWDYFGGLAAYRVQ